MLSLEELCYRVLPRVHPGRALSDSEWRTLESAAEVLLEGCPVQVSPAQVADNVESFLIEGRSRRAWRCRVLLTLLECATLPYTGRRFSALSPVARRRFARREMAGGRGVWRLCAKVRILVVMGAYGDAAARPATGFVRVADRVRFRAGTEATHVTPLRVSRAEPNERESSLA